MTEETGVQNALDDVTSNICTTLFPGLHNKIMCLAWQHRVRPGSCCSHVTGCH